MANQWFRYLDPHRLAAYLLLLFCAGHTAGGMLSHKSLGAPADAVLASMRAVRFEFNGSTCSYYGFWFAFGLMVSVFLLLSAFVAWHLGGAEARHWPALAPIAWALFAAHAANAYFSWAYFFAGPGVLSTLVAVLLGVGAWRRQRRAA